MHMCPAGKRLVWWDAGAVAWVERPPTRTQHFGLGVQLEVSEAHVPPVHGADGTPCGPWCTGTSRSHQVMYNHDRHEWYATCSCGWRSTEGDHVLIDHLVRQHLA